MYNPMKPRSVNQPLPADTLLEKPWAVRIRPYTTQGWRPTSAVIQPAVLAM